MTRITTIDSQNSSTPLPPNGKTVLIAEDDPFISRMYETKLKASGYNVIIKNNGRDAYEDIKSTKPDLLLLDLNMPELTGFEMLNALQNDGFDFEAMPVFILTNSSQEKDRQSAKKFGAEFFIKAELTPRDIVQKINARLGLEAAPES
jgi:CheY-like chemotaxis protein